MKKILLFQFSFIDSPFPARKLIFKKEVTEIIPIGTEYLPFGNKLRSGIITSPHTINEETNEFIMVAVSEMPFKKYNHEEGDYIRKNMKKYSWSIFLDDIDRLD
ncbi:hypothetical protein A2645_00770 [Candidatus Nomurabacteria bacterium RIFCSPHIGHO2_01_FULL_39_9]|uniref:Uncharacterized protein n=1 Tax=Candidatus Nomurabacteria bacterium RIFCSPHIGHO2_01_FULL_39_9 TaxID=1801735 RepID=A0A1F6UVE4_9BACT|nr:MAG: hypothetical protein A2645_00770 [Candidatus Nomurabacteria bacterium RIFCSPHIGHO2_01_FULL_39_9]